MSGSNVCRSSIQYIMFAGHGQSDFGLLAFSMNNEIGDAFFRLEDFGSIVTILAKSETNTVLRFDVEPLLHDDKVVCQMCKFIETGHQMFSVAIYVKMIGIYGIDDTDIGV